jgi:hypothetical protein
MHSGKCICNLVFRSRTTLFLFPAECVYECLIAVALSTIYIHSTDMLVIIFAKQCSFSRQEDAFHVLFRRTSGFVLLTFSDFTQ